MLLKYFNFPETALVCPRSFSYGPAGLCTEVESNLEVILLLVFMVAGIYFMRSLLLLVFTDGDHGSALHAGTELRGLADGVHPAIKRVYTGGAG